MICLIRFFILIFILFPNVTNAAENMAKGSVGKAAKILPLTGEMIDEALQMTEECKGNNFTNVRYDCDCVGMQFLEIRRKKGLEESAFWIREDAQRNCPNRPAMAGKIYSECLGWAAIQRGEDYKEFCSCYGTKFAQIYGGNPSENLIVVEAQMTVAMSKCNVNSVNERLQARDSFVKKLKESGVYYQLFPGALPSN